MKNTKNYNNKIQKGTISNKGKKDKKVPKKYQKVTKSNNSNKSNDFFLKY